MYTIEWLVIPILVILALIAAGLVVNARKRKPARSNPGYRQQYRDSMRRKIASDPDLPCEAGLSFPNRPLTPPYHGPCGSRPCNHEAGFHEH